jgi:hypothetical protein
MTICLPTSVGRPSTDRLLLERKEPPFAAVPRAYRRGSRWVRYCRRANSNVGGWQFLAGQWPAAPATGLEEAAP